HELVIAADTRPLLLREQALSEETLEVLLLRQLSREEIVLVLGREIRLQICHPVDVAIEPEDVWTGRPLNADVDRLGALPQRRVVDRAKPDLAGSLEDARVDRLGAAVVDDDDILDRWLRDPRRQRLKKVLLAISHPRHDADHSDEPRSKPDRQ